MGTRGRKSAAELAVATPPGLIVTARQDAPYDLRDEEADVWRGIVESLPADWIAPGSVPVLAAYCRATVSARRLGMLIVAVETGEGYDADQHMKLIRAHGQVAQVLKTLATALRLTPQSRYTPARAGNQRPEGSRPWEFSHG
ncbi:MAG: hypothetical protein LCH69_10050 [Proteobacteria bacterium]|nr:hypothetical protein [Pseudomonadota bacterium]